jgi:hypothetical protein
MRSYPTYVPLNAAQVRHLRDMVDPFNYGALYGYAWDRVVAGDASRIVAQTAARYLKVLGASA